MSQSHSLESNSQQPIRRLQFKKERIINITPGGEAISPGTDIETTLTTQSTPLCTAW